MSPSEVVENSVAAAERLGRHLGYKPIGASNYCHIEAGRLDVTTDRARAVLCVVFGVDRDTLAFFLDQRLSIGDVLRLRDAPAPTPTERLAALVQPKRRTGAATTRKGPATGNAVAPGYT